MANKKEKRKKVAKCQKQRKKVAKCQKQRKKVAKCQKQMPKNKSVKPVAKKQIVTRTTSSATNARQKRTAVAATAKIQKPVLVVATSSKPDTLLGKGPIVVEEKKVDDSKEPWTQEGFNPMDRTGELKCEYCPNPISTFETPVVLEWDNSKDSKKKRPTWMGRAIKRAAHLKCDREQRGWKPKDKKEKAAVKAEKATGAVTGKAPSEPRQSKPRASGNDLQKIYRLKKENPRKPGTHGWKSYELIKDGMTVQDYLAAGGRRNDLAWDIEHSFVEVK